ncbi:uncharacterized protein LOC122378245 isoform X2 [Amphibalanus amphitrite]|uniref:uncharacterized protein LOC122378245 isoform X2 n=1 Tax=Amphibalanus amphitrite TaxID=1232801 RepID=UPI001C8FC345|nr:uncharacterized protein LOC122378245 isoform X2 [Amphibalanus amphitrite]
MTSSGALSMEVLPTEVLERIFAEVELENVPALSRACKRFEAIFGSCDIIWRRLFQLRFVRMCQSSEKEELELLLASQGHSWYGLAQHRLQIGRMLRERLDYLADRYNGLGEALPDPVMEDFRAMVRHHGSLIMRDALLDEVVPRQQRRGALARRYYATMVYREIERDLVLLPMMRSFTRLPEQSRTVTATFHLLSYWLRPELDPGPTPDIEGCHRQVARRVLRLVRQRHPRHPLSGWADCKLTPDGPGGWTLTEGRQLLDCINLIVFGQMELTLLKGRLGGELSRICDRNCSVYEEDDFGELSGQRLQRAGPTRQRPPEGEKVFSAYSSYLAGGGHFLGVVSAVYASVAGLLGLELHFILCPDTWLLCWPIGTEDRHIYVDMNQSGAQLTRREACLQLMFQSPDHAPEALLEPVPKHKLLWRLVSGMFCPKDHALAVADQVSMRLLHYWLFDNCEIHEISMCSMVMVLERSRPMYLHRLSQARLEASHLVENPVAERTALPAYLDRLRADHLRLVKSVNLQRSRDEQMMEAKQWPPPEGFCRFQVGDMVQLGDHPHRRAVVYSVVLRLHLVAGNPCQLCVVGRLNPPPHHLRVGRYRLLLDGNEKMDVEEDSICASPWAAPIENCELGRYFTGFDGRRYVPLPSLARRARERPDAGPVEEHRPWPRPLRPPPVSWRVAWPRRLPYDVEFQPGDEDAVAAPQEIELGGLVLH